METMQFRGAEKLIGLVNAAVEESEAEKTTALIKSGLCKLIRSGEVELPEAVKQPHADRYARRLICLDEERGYSIVAMTWGPCQSTPLHDHAGLWCVEGVWHGSLEVQQYELIEQQGDRYCLEKRTIFEAGVGSAGCLIPPYEYHRILNPCDSTAAVSVHIYGGDMCACHVFEPTDEANWYVRKSKPLSLDACAA